MKYRTKFRITHLKLVLVFCIISINQLYGQEKSEKLPNIIIIFADDMGYGDLGCHGATRIKTPNIDKLALEGIRFTDVHTAGSVCQPSRYSLLTGRYWWRSPRFLASKKESNLHGHMPEMLEDNVPTIATVLKQKGYTTGAIGKWHLGVNWVTTDGNTPLADGGNVDYSKPFTGGPLSHGFDYYFGIIASLNMCPFTFIENNKTVGIPDKYREKDPNNQYAMYEKGKIVDGWRDERVGPNFTRKAVNFIENHINTSPEKPFFLYLPLSAPHSPFTPPEFIKGKSEAGDRGDMVAEADWTVGELQETINRLQIVDNTLIIFTSDNGSRIDGTSKFVTDPKSYSVEFTDHKPNGYLRGEKGDIWEGGHRVPFIVNWPGKIKSGKINSALVCLTDLFRTITSITRTFIEEEAAEDSFDISGLFFGDNSSKSSRKSIIHKNGLYAIRTKDWKFIDGQGSGGFMGPTWTEIPDEPKGQLYHMIKDPVEYQNVYNVFPDTVKSLKKKLEFYKTHGSRE